MKKITGLIINVIICVNISAQEKEGRMDTLHNYLLLKTYDLFQPHADLTYSFGTDELKNELPDLNYKIRELKDTAAFFEELKGDYKDWFVFYKIGNLYQKFNQGQHAMNYYNQAYNLIYNEVMKDTLKSGPVSDLASLYMNLNNSENAFYFFRKAYELDSKDSLASLFLPMFYIFNSNAPLAEEIIKKRLVYDPQNINLFIWLVMARIFKEYPALNKENKALLDKTIDQIFDLKDISIAAKKFNKDVSFSILELLGRQLALFAKYSALSDNIRNASLSAQDLKELKIIRKSLLSHIKKGEFKNKYILYKSLGFNYLLEKNLESAIENFKESINFWPKDKISGDYTIQFTCQYFIKNDTLAALQVIEQKINNNRETALLNADDFVLKGNVLYAKNDFAGAENAWKDALAIRPVPNAYLGLSLLEIKENRLKEANHFINKAYELDKEYYLTYALFGIITLMNNQKPEAKNALEKAMQLKPGEKTVNEIYHGFFE
jgi:tetratricopeptide (TPR) repeat protein